MLDVSENLLYEIERHCNNYFNQQNNPDSTERNYPPAFLELAAKIEKFVENIERNNTTASRVGSGTETLDLDFQSWQKAFARDLSIYKRVKII